MLLLIIDSCNQGEFLRKKRIELTIASEQTNRIKTIQGLETVSGSGKKYDNPI